jgi:hypothetical protein
MLRPLLLELPLLLQVNKNQKYIYASRWEITGILSCVSEAV